MGIREQLTNDMKEAMKAREAGKTKLAVIRMVRSSVKNAEIDQGRELNDQEISAVIIREIKQRKESLAEYERAGRDETVQTLQEEIAVLQNYLPEQLSESEIEQMVRQIISETDASGPKDMGKVMGPLMARIKGRAEGSVVNQIVRRLLQG